MDVSRPLVHLGRERINIDIIEIQVTGARNLAGLTPFLIVFNM